MGSNIKQDSPVKIKADHSQELTVESPEEICCEATGVKTQLSSEGTLHSHTPAENNHKHFSHKLSFKSDNFSKIPAF